MEGKLPVLNSIPAQKRYSIGKRYLELTELHLSEPNQKATDYYVSMSYDRHTTSFMCGL